MNRNAASSAVDRRNEEADVPMKASRVGLAAWLPVVLLLMAAGAQAQHAHRHGVGQLEIVVDQGQLSLALLIPQHDLVGFERPAKSPREQLAAQAVLEKLRDPAQLFTLPAAAQCTAQAPRIDAPLLAAASAAAHAHGDVEARYVYHCANPPALDRLVSQVATAFPRVRALVVNFAGPQGQKAGRLDAGKTEFRW